MELYRSAGSAAPPKSKYFSNSSQSGKIPPHACEWLKRTPDLRLDEINPRLRVAKRVFPQFWRLKDDVRNYFLANAEDPKERKTLQTIELLCNAREVVQELSLEAIRTLSGLLHSPKVPEYIRKEVADYFENKGQRGWRVDDRRIVPLAWRDIRNP